MWGASLANKPHPNKKDRAFPGMILGKLRLIRRVRKPSGTYGDVWQVQCQCAFQTVLTVKEQYLFRNPNPKRHCGCENKGLPTLHPKEYNVWVSMNNRCLRPDHVSWPEYGGRGIRICADWHRDNPLGQSVAFANFLRDMGKRPDGMTLDRREVNGHYTKGNCRWATPTEQARNKRSDAIRRYYANKAQSTQSAPTSGNEEESNN